MSREFVSGLEPSPAESRPTNPPAISPLLSGEVAVGARVKKLPSPVALSAPITRIAVFHPNSLAALAFSLPALVALRESFPAAQIHSYARAQLLPILQNFGAINEAHARPGGGVPAQAALMARLRAHDYDLALSFSQSSNALLLTWATHADVRAGFVPSRLESFLTHRVGKTGALSESVALDLVRAVGAQPRGAKARDFLHYPPETRAKIQTSLERAGIEGRDFLVLAPENRANKSKKSPAKEEQWREKLPELSDSWPLVICGPRHFESARSLGARPFLNLSGRLDGLALAFLLEASRGVLGDEAGALALGRVLEKKVVATSPENSLQAGKTAFGL